MSTAGNSETGRGSQKRAEEAQGAHRAAGVKKRHDSPSCTFYMLSLCSLSVLLSVLLAHYVCKLSAYCLTDTLSAAFALSVCVCLLAPCLCDLCLLAPYLIALSLLSLYLAYYCLRSLDIDNGCSRPLCSRLASRFLSVCSGLCLFDFYLFALYLFALLSNKFLASRV
jgi:hypothetical protein